MAKKTCETCFYYLTEEHDWPCFSCGKNGLHYYYPRIADPSCKACEFYDIPGDLYPCRHCDNSFTDFKPAYSKIEPNTTPIDEQVKQSEHGLLLGYIKLLESVVVSHNYGLATVILGKMQAILPFLQPA